MSKTGDPVAEMDYPWVTPPASLDPPTPDELGLSRDLEAYIQHVGGFLSQDDVKSRDQLVRTVEGFLKTWVSQQAQAKGLPEDVQINHGARIMVFGSQHIGIVTRDSDIDTVCIVPHFITRDAFFSSFMAFLRRQPQVKTMRAVEGARVPLIEMVFERVQVDLLICMMKPDQIPDDLDVLQDSILDGMDPGSCESINGVRETILLLDLVPNKESFMKTLKVVKHWIKVNSLRDTGLGFLSSFGWTVLVARVCQLYPNACLATLVRQFLITFSTWGWPQPVLLRPLIHNKKLKLKPWNPTTNPTHKLHKMPVITPAYPEHNAGFTVTLSTRKLMSQYLHMAATVSGIIMSHEDGWEELFCPQPFFSKYSHFLMVTASALSEQDHFDWTGLVKSKLRLLVLSLEKQPAIDWVHPYATPYTRPQVEPGKESTSWFIGLQFLTSHGVSLDVASDIKSFNQTCHESALGLQLHKKGMTLAVKHIRWKQLHEVLPPEFLARS